MMPLRCEKNLAKIAVRKKRHQSSSHSLIFQETQSSRVAERRRRKVQRNKTRLHLSSRTHLQLRHRHHQSWISLSGAVAAIPLAGLARRNSYQVLKRSKSQVKRRLSQQWRWNNLMKASSSKPKSKIWKFSRALERLTLLLARSKMVSSLSRMRIKWAMSFTELWPDRHFLRES